MGIVYTISYGPPIHKDPYEGWKIAGSVAALIGVTGIVYYVIRSFGRLLFIILHICMCVYSKASPKDPLARVQGKGAGILAGAECQSDSRPQLGQEGPACREGRRQLADVAHQ